MTDATGRSRNGHLLHDAAYHAPQRVLSTAAAGHRGTTMRITARQAVAVLLAIATTMVVVAPANGAAPPRSPKFETLRPGEEVLVDSPIRVNIVMVGYEPDSFDVDRVIDRSPDDVTPRRPSKGQAERRPRRGRARAHATSTCPASPATAFDDAFFAHLAATGSPGPAGTARPVVQRPGAQRGRRVAGVPLPRRHRDRAVVGAAGRRAARRQPERLHGVPRQLVGPTRLPVPRLPGGRRPRARHGLRHRGRVVDPAHLVRRLDRDARGSSTCPPDPTTARRLRRRHPPTSPATA